MQLVIRHMMYHGTPATGNVCRTAVSLPVHLSPSMLLILFLAFTTPAVTVRVAIGNNSGHDYALVDMTTPVASPYKGATFLQLGVAQATHGILFCRLWM